MLRCHLLLALVVGSTPAQFAALLKNDLARWAKVIKTAHVQVD